MKSAFQICCAEEEVLLVKEERLYWRVCLVVYLFSSFLYQFLGYKLIFPEDFVFNNVSFFEEHKLREIKLYMFPCSPILVFIYYYYFFSNLGSSV